MNNTTFPVSVVVPVHNQLMLTQRYIQSLEKQYLTRPMRVFVVDNASTDGTREWLNNYRAQGSIENSPIEDFCVITNAENLGFSKAVNQAIVTSQELYGITDVVVTNNDMMLDEGCIEALCDFGHRTKGAGVVGGKLRFPDGTLQHAGAFLNGLGWGQHKEAGAQYDNKFITQIPVKQEYVTGALFFIRCDVLSVLSGFDEKYSPAYFEEVSFCYQVRKHGFDVWYCPDATAIHYENRTGVSIYKDAAALKKTLSDTNQIKFYLEREEDEYAPTSDDRILISSKIYGEWSFCGVMRNLAKGLSRNGVDVSIAPEEYHEFCSMEDWEIKEMILKPNDYWNRTVLRSCEGDHMYLMPPGKRRIAHTTGESSRINRYWKDQLNRVDLVLTTSNFFRGIMQECGVTTITEVLPNSVDTDLFNPATEKFPLSGLRGFTFYSMFHFGERKNPEALIKAFGEEFSESEDVSLFIHSLSIEHALRQRNMTVQQWIQGILGNKPHAPILITSNYVSDKIMPNLIKNFDVFVLPTRGEGFGLPVLEASAMGVPSIVTGYSGVLDIVDENSGWCVDYKMQDIPLQHLPYFKNYIGGQWAEISIEHLRTTMRQAFENPELCKHKGLQALKKAQDFSISNVGALAKSLIF